LGNQFFQPRQHFFVIDDADIFLDDRAVGVDDVTLGEIDVPHACETFPPGSSKIGATVVDPPRILRRRPCRRRRWSRTRRTAAFEVPMQFLQVRRLLAARRAPRRPEVHQHDLALHVGERRLASAEPRQFQFRRGKADSGAARRTTETVSANAAAAINIFLVAFVINKI